MPLSWGESALQPDRYSGLAWSAPVTVAEASNSPRTPHLEANPGGTFSLLWEDFGLWHLLLDPSGRPLSTPRLVGREQPSRWSMHGQAAFFARDALGDLHMVWEKDATMIHYRKVDASGKALVPDKLLLREPFGAHGASLCILDGSLLVGYVRYEPSLGEYRFAVQRLDLDGNRQGQELSVSAGDGVQPLDGEMLPAPDGGLDIVLAVPDGGLFMHLDATGRLTQRANIPYLPRGVIPALARGESQQLVLAWNTWETGASGRIVAARISDIGAEPVFITSQSMAVSDPSLAIEQGGEALLCWEDARLGRNEAFYSVLRPDVWDAYPPNQRIPGADLNPGQLAVSVDSSNRVLAAWVNGDLLKGARALSFGFELSGGLGSVRPHATSSVAVELGNTGGLADTITLALDVSGLPPGWKAALLGDYASLPASEGRVIVQIALSGPESDAGPRHGYFRLIATSAGNTRLRQELLIPVDMEVGYFTVASLTPSAARAPPGGTAAFELELRNAGDAGDELLLDAQSAQGLSMSLGRPNVELNWSAEDRVPVTARVTKDSAEGDSLQFSVTVRSAVTGRAKTLLGTVLVSPGVQIWLSAPVGQKNILPGSTGSFSIMVGNAGNSDGPAEVGLEVVSGWEGWTASIDTPNIDLAAGDVTEMSLTVTAPADATGRFVVRVLAAAIGWDSSASITVTAIAEPTHELLAHAGFPAMTALPSAKLRVPVSVSNRGSSPEEVSVELQLPAGWAGESRLDGGALAQEFTIFPKEDVTLNVVIVAPADASAGPAEAAVLLSARSGASARAVLDISVSQLFEISIQTTTPVLRATPGDPAVAVLSVRNIGNGPDSISLDTESPPGWNIDLADIDQKPLERLSIPARASSTVIVQVWAPFTSSDAWSEVSVAATSQSGLRARLALRVGLLLPDLSLSVSYSPARFAAGRTVLATVTVSNTGEAPAHNVRVAFNVDGEGAHLERILLIPPGSEKTATFSWTPVAGRHVLRFEADPEHMVLERDEGNNMLLEKVSISGAPPAQAEIAPAVIAVGSATFILGAIGLAAGGTEGGKYWAAGLLFLPLYTKIKKDDVLDHFVRGQVYGYIKANPGEHYNSIKKALSLKNGTLIYHLKTLENGDFIKSVIDGRFKRFYPKEMKLPEPSDEIVLRMNHIQHEILNIIRETPGISQKEIAARIGLSTPTVHYHINIMMSARAINVMRSGRETRCYVEDGQEGRAG
jgi:uncharacterized membrane protein/DNA-binding transcriptional regulator YiaG